MKKMIFVCLLAILAVNGHAQRGRASVGSHLGYALDCEAATIGFDYRYHFLPDFRLAPSITYMIRNNDVSAWYMDMDFHYMVPVSSIFSFYPIGGVGLSIWNWNGREGNDTRLGLNVGLGGELRLTREISVGLDMKYNVVSTYDQALTAVRVAYHF
ncbi:MAG: outer membrane beta-barrel protein [Tannerella sp.]|jgi:outer membrane protein X|nr:outer membrane beta-barrel protein [Tannerella sp.]